MKLLKGRLLWFTEKPSLDSGYTYIEDGAVAIESGKIVSSGRYQTLAAEYPAAKVDDYGDQIIMPGFIDTHIHYPQCGVIASFGEQLLDWLDNYTFPAEQAFANASHSEQVAKLFVNELFKNGTTTALVYGTVHPESVDALFTECEKTGARMIAGKVMMDRHAPDALLDTAETGYQQSKALIERWHGKGRLSYAVTPRFAPTSTEAQLAKAGQLMTEYADLYMQTHLSENPNEVAWVKELFPKSANYLDVYDNFGLLGEKSVFGHGIWLEDSELKRLHATGSSIAFCPTSNLFLGSGLLDLARLENNGVKVNMATDVGGGTSFSMLTTTGEAYKILQLQGQKLHPLDAFYRITLGNAQTLGLADNIGKLEAGYEADITIINTSPTDIAKYRRDVSKHWFEELFAAQTLGDDRWISATYVNGERVYTSAEVA